MPGRGKLIVLGMLLLAVALAVGNMLFQTRASGRAVAHWGDDAARLILTASQVEFLELRPEAKTKKDGEADRLNAGDQSFVIDQRRDASQAPGMLHFRRALVADSLYDWDAPPAARSWRYAVRFRDEERAFTLVISDDYAAVAGLDDAHTLGVRGNAQGTSPLQAFVAEQFAGQGK